jgi:very-short-patch-repair endonuclease
LTLLDELLKLEPSALSEQRVETDTGCFIVDTLVQDRKLIIEYNGDWWHANPDVYGPEDMVGVNYGTRAQDVWARDSKRKAALERAGYAVLVVWERDWTRRRDATLESIKTELEKFGQAKNRSY